MAERTRRRTPRRPTFWRLLTLGGVIVGVTSLLRMLPEPVTALGKPSTPPSREALQSGFEAKDVNERTIVFILAGIAAATALVIGTVFIMIWRFEIAWTHSFSSLTPQQTAQSAPPAPHLQINPFADLAQQRAREDRLLHSYGWTSADHSTARIPIDRAMALTVGTSLDASP